MLYFNSIKVRLKQANKRKRFLKMSTFQFHKGTIKTGMIVMLPLVNLKFQFHKGTIKTVPFLTFCNHLKNFNSIKVRLKL